MLQRLLCASLAAGLCQIASAADSQDERLRNIEERLQRIEGSPDQPRATPPARPTSNVFNPAISLILDGQFTNFSQNSNSYAIPGFALAGETGPGDEGLRLGESELAISANVDDKFYGQFNAAVTPENSPA